MTDAEAVLDALAAGLSVEKAAKRFKLPVAEVRQLLRAEVERCRDGEYLRETLALTDRRLAAVELKFYNQALEGDAQSAIVFVKTSERRATLNGFNKPVGHVVQVLQATPERQQTSTDRIEAAIKRIRGESSPLPRHDRDTSEDTSGQPH